MKLRDLTLERRPHVFDRWRQHVLGINLNNVVVEMQARRSKSYLPPDGLSFRDAFHYVRRVPGREWFQVIRHQWGGEETVVLDFLTSWGIGNHLSLALTLKDPLVAHRVAGVENF